MVSVQGDGGWQAEEGEGQEGKEGERQRQKEKGTRAWFGVFGNILEVYEKDVHQRLLSFDLLGRRSGLNGVEENVVDSGDAEAFEKISFLLWLPFSAHMSPEKVRWVEAEYYRRLHRGKATPSSRPTDLISSLSFSSTELPIAHSSDTKQSYVERENQSRCLWKSESEKTASSEPERERVGENGEEEKSQTHEASSQEAFMVDEKGMDEALSDRLEHTTREMRSARAEDTEKRKGRQEY